MSLVPVTTDAIERASDPGKFVELACERAKEWLAQALEHGDIDGIVELKSQAEAIRTYTVQKQLGKDAELSAAEIVRRAERGIGLAIRKGQEAGNVRRRGEGGGDPRYVDPAPHRNKMSPKDYFNGGSEESDVYAVAAASEDTFEAALSEAKDERNLSRSNVVRKVAQTRIARGEGEGESKVAKARRMAGEGYTSRQIGDSIGIKDMGDFRYRHGIDVPADAAVGKTRRHDSNRIVSETVTTCEALVIGIQLVELADLDAERVADWATSLSDSLRSLNRLSKQLKEMAL